VLPVYDYPWKPGLEPAEKIEALNELLVMLSIEKGYEYADYFSAMANEQKGLKKDLGNDGVHPNLKGYNIMKPIVLKALVKALMP
jgi:lysophospholipase L1-like esterase